MLNTLGYSGSKDLFPVGDVLQAPEQEDAPPLRPGSGLHDPNNSRILLEFFHKYVVFRLRIKRREVFWYQNLSDLKLGLVFLYYNIEGHLKSKIPTGSS